MTIPDEQIIETSQIRRHSLYQLAADVVVPNSGALPGVFRGVIENIYDWLQERLATTLDDEIRQCDGYAADASDFPTLFCQAIFDEYLWSARLVQTSSPFEGQEPIAERTWTTDIALRYDGTNLRLGAHVRAASTGRALGQRVQCGKLALIGQLASRYGLRDVRRLDGQPWILEKKNDLRRFHDFLADPRRSLPVILLTQIDRSRDPRRKFSFTLDDLQMARLGIGIAHVVCLSKGCEADWSKMVGSAWAAGQGAVRIYKPNLSWEKDSPSIHPRAIPNRPGDWPDMEKLNWQYTDGSNEKDFRMFLLQEALRFDAMQIRNWDDFLFCREILSRRNQLKREEDAENDRKRAEELAKIESKDELCEELSKEVERLKKRTDQLQADHAKEIDDFEQWLQENKAQLEESRLAAQSDQRQLEELKTDNHYLRVLNDTLRSSRRAKTGNDKEDKIPIPKDYTEIDEWVKTHLTGRLIMVPKAAHKARNASYKNVELVYQALLLLGGPFRDMKLDPAMEETWEMERAQLGLHFGHSISESELGKYREKYLVDYPLHSPKRRFVEYHLRKGTAREERDCLAIYFFWDDETRQVVVGWLPSHLENRMS